MCVQIIVTKTSWELWVTRGIEDLGNTFKGSNWRLPMGFLCTVYVTNLKIRKKRPRSYDKFISELTRKTLLSHTRPLLIPTLNIVHIRTIMLIHNHTFSSAQLFLQFRVTIFVAYFEYSQNNKKEPLKICWLTLGMKINKGVLWLAMAYKIKGLR